MPARLTLKRLPPSLRPARARKAKAPAPTLAPAVAVEVALPVVVVSEANLRDGRWAHIKRAKLQRTEVRLFLYTLLPSIRHWFHDRSLSIVLTRVGGKLFDGDNLARAFKAVRDGVADWLGRDDGDPSIAWEYRQESGPGPRGVRVRVGRGA
jgi:hypothetical protein